MPLTDQDIRALTYLAIQCRPPGARSWDEAGVFASIAKVRHLHLADVALAVIRAADDSRADTPGVISNTSAPNWQERKSDRPQSREVFDAATFCGVCSQSRSNCERNNNNGHSFVSIVEATRNARSNK